MPLTWYNLAHKEKYLTIVQRFQSLVHIDNNSKSKQTNSFDSGGDMILPKTAHENEVVNNITRPYHTICEVEDEGGKMTWLRLVPDQKGRWKDPITGVRPPFANWKRGKQVETEDNCAFMLSGDIDRDGKWSSGTCTEQSPR